MKPTSKAESNWSWAYREGKRFCVMSAKVARHAKRGLSKARRRSCKQIYYG